MAAITYDSKDVVVTLNGVLISGFRDGDKVTIERDGDLWTKKVGVDGVVLRARNNQSVGGKITLGLMYGSEGNAVITALNLADRLTGSAPSVLSVIDIRGGSTAFSQTAWLMTEPSPSHGSEPGDMEYVYDCAQLETVYSASQIV